MKDSRSEADFLRQAPLSHRQQTGPHGCLYHALYALTGNEAVLDHAPEISTARFYARVHALGLMVVALHVGERAPETFWNSLPPGEVHALLISVPADRLPGMEHAVALEVRPRAWAIVSDSRHDGLLALTWPEFLTSEYARPLRVEVVTPADLDAYPHEDARESVARALDRQPNLTL